MTNIKETIEWKSVEEELPDSDITVLVFREDENEVALGYFDESNFLTVGGFPAHGITHWADMPFGPTVIGVMGDY